MNRSEVFARERVNQMVTPTEDYYPDHDGGKFAPILATVATWRAPRFLENLAIDAEGAVFVTVYSHNRVDRYDPATARRPHLRRCQHRPWDLRLMPAVCFG